MEEKSRIDWKCGDTAIVAAGVHRQGVSFNVLGPAVFLKQWWVPIEDPDEEDPSFHKESCLELFKLEDICPSLALGCYPYGELKNILNF